jgi:hypothetical protein
MGSSELDLRVDIDPRYQNSPVMDRVSADVYRVFEFRVPGWPPLPGRPPSLPRPPIRWRVYQESWIIDTPSVAWHRCKVVITGTVRFYKGTHPVTTAHIDIPWGSFQSAGPATVTLTEASGTKIYSCARQSHCFRDLDLEIDVCESVNTAPTVPTYDTHSHDNRPADLPQRTLTIEEAFREAGICVNVLPEQTVIDDSDPDLATWSDDELHDAMEQHFSRYPGAWPKWAMWGLLASRYEVPSVAGIMFDYGTAYGGPGRAPERQGFAVFRQHSWFNALVETPATQAQAAAARQFLYTWVHEAGHAFNFLHSWDKSRPDALSWMNYDWRYDNRNGQDSFWGDFEFRFDDEELIHLRHGDRSEVIPGGDPWSTGWHLEAPVGAMSQEEGDAPLELLVRSKQSFSLLEPIVIELRLRNDLEGIPLAVDPRLSPEYGTVAIHIRQPDGHVVEYHPIACKLALPEAAILQGKEAREGEDRISRQVLLSFGRDGFCFDQPGVYLVRALYVGLGDLEVTSNLHRIYVGPPTSPQENELVARYLTYEVGMNLYLGGSLSPFLKQGFQLLREVAERFQDSMPGARAARLVGHALARPFTRIEDDALVNIHEPEPEQALEVTEAARDLCHESEDPSFNIEYHQLARDRAQYLAMLHREDDARRELQQLRDDLAERRVNEPVLESIDEFTRELSR